MTKFEKGYNIFMWVVRIAAIAMLINISCQKCQNKKEIKKKAVITNNQKTR